MSDREALTLIMDLVYPVGSIYMSTQSFNPATLFGGKWKQLENRFLLGAGTEYNVGDKGGYKNATLVDHNHISYNKRTNITHKSSGDTAVLCHRTNSYASESAAGDFIKTTGESAANKNMPPYLVVYMWERLPDSEDE